MPPNMTPTELERWATKQIDAIVARGINVLDATSAVKRFLSKLPPGADPDTYVPQDGGEVGDLSSKDATDDARAAWYGDARVPSRWKRILDSKGEG